MWRHRDALNTNADFLRDGAAAILDAVDQAQELDPATRFDFLKIKLAEVSQVAGKKAKREREKEINLLNNRLKVLDKDPLRNAFDIAMTQARLKAFHEEADFNTIRDAKAKWTEQGEKCTRYFFAILRKRFREANVLSLKNEDGTDMTYSQTQAAIHHFYADLYAGREVDRLDRAAAWTQVLADLPKLIVPEQEVLAAPILIGECKTALFKKMKEGKAPGPDGLTVGLLRRFWPQLGQHLHASLEYAIERGMMSVHQRSAMIRLIQKKGKDPAILTNWRPISLMNTDTKVSSRVLAERIKPLLDKLISPEQLAFVAGRQMVEGNRLNVVFRQIKFN